MRFCFVLPYLDEQRNSFSKLLAPLARELLGLGHDVTILSGNTGYTGEFSNQHRSLTLRFARIAFIQVLFFVAGTSLWLWKRRKSFDVIHNLGIGSTLYQNVLTAHACHRAWLAVKWRKKQYFTLFLNPLHPITIAVESFNYRRRIPIIAVCQSLAHEIAHYYPKTKDRIQVINNGVDHPKGIVPTPRIDRARPGLIIGFASNDHGKKGLFELVDALELAHNRGQIWYVHVLGSDPRQKIWQSYVDAKKLSDFVVFAGHVKAIRNYFAAVDVFCLPSHYEPFGLVFLEAAQVACPIVGTALGVCPDLMQSFGDHRLHPLALPLKVEALYEQLALLASTPKLRAELGKHVQTEARRFSDRNMVREQLAFYQKMFGSSSVPTKSLFRT